MTESGDNSVGTLSEKLRQAATQGQFDLVKELVKNGAQFSSDQEGRTALHYAALNGHVDICKFLIQQGCSINEKDLLGYTPLHRAASKGHVEAIDLLLTSKCDVDSQDEHGNGAIHESSWNGFSQTLELLIKHHCNVILTNKSGFTALHLASQNGHNQSARVLLYGGCNADLKNNYGDTALHTAARYGHAGVTRILISARCRMNEQNKNGDTALHISAALKRKKIAKLLVEAGIDINIVNKQEETAVDVARRKEHPEIIMTITSFVKTKASVHPVPKMVNFSETPVDIDGPVVVPDEDIPVTSKTEKSGSKLLSFFKKKKKEKDKPTQSGGQVHPTPGKPAVQGFFSQYIPKNGQQYYRDLAGNIKQGPVGYTPICQCMPALHQLEKKVDKDKEHIYEHIDASHQILKNRMDLLDRKTTQQLDSFDRWSHDRFDEEERNCYSRIDQRLADQQHYMANRNYRGGMDVDDWLEAKLGEYGHCLDHHHDDTALPSNNIFTDIHQTENGRLFRSRSDETLSQSDNHSGRFRKRQFYESRQQAMQQIRAWQVPSFNQTNRNPVVGRRFNNGAHQGSNQQQTYMSPPAAHHNVRPSSRPEFISPSTASTSRSPYMSHDPMYGSQYNGYEKGAIAKKLPTSQTWHGAHELSAAINNNTDYASYEQSNRYRDSSPLNHSTPNVKSRESSPYDYHSQRPIVKSRTIPENLTPRHNESRNVQSENRTMQVGNRTVQSGNRNIYGENRNVYNDSRQLPMNDASPYGGNFDRQNDYRRSNMETRNIKSEIRNSDTRRSFPERGSSNTSTGTNATSNSSSTGQGPLTESSAGKRPTFSTFGYATQSNTPSGLDKLKTADSEGVINSLSVEDTVKNSESHQTQAILQTGDKLNGNALPVDFVDNNQDKTNSERLNARNSVYNQNRDDMFVSQGQNSLAHRQRSRSSDGLLLEDDLTSAYQMKRKSQSSTQQSGSQNSPREGQAYNVQLETLKRSNPNYGSSRTFSNGRIDQVSRTYPNEQGARSIQNDRNYQSSRTYLNDSPHSHLTEFSSRPQVNNIANRTVQNPQFQRSSPLNLGQYQGHSSSVQFQGQSSKGQYQGHNSNGQYQGQSSYGQFQGHGSNGQMYTSNKTVQPIRPYSEQDYRDRPTQANEGPYGSTRNFANRSTNPQTGRSMYNVYNSNFQGSNNNVYNHTNMQRLNSKSEPNIDSNLQCEGLYPNADRNLQSTPIQDKSQEENSSNPDSGYSSKIFGRNINSGNAPSTSCTPSSSFSTEPTDHNITLSSNNSPHPQVNHSDYVPMNTVKKQQYQQELSDHVQQWYQRKLKTAAQSLNEKDYGSHGNYSVQSNNVNKSSDRYAGFDYVQPSQQTHLHANQRFTNYQQVPNYIHGSDV